MAHTEPGAAARCAGQTWGGAYGGVRCHNNGKVEEDGKLWCRTHAPSLVAARRKARTEKWDAEWKQERATRTEAKAKLAEQERRAECYPTLLAALKEVRDTLEGDCTDGARVTAGNIACAAIEEAS